jgi:hypothetical protein
MDLHVEEPREARASLPDEVRQIASALMDLLENAAALPTHVRTPVRVACEAVSRRLNETRLTVALAGDAGAGSRTLINALLGDRVLTTNTPRRGSTTTIVRCAPALDFSAHSPDGHSVVHLSRNMPDRQMLFKKSMAQIDRETTAIEQLAGRLRVARQRVAELETSIDGHANGELQSDGSRAPLERAPEPPSP